MLVYVLLAIYLFVLFLSVRSSQTVDENEIVLKDAPPIRPLEYARAIGIIVAVVAVIAFISQFINR